MRFNSIFLIVLSLLCACSASLKVKEVENPADGSTTMHIQATGPRAGTTVRQASVLDTTEDLTEQTGVVPSVRIEGNELSVHSGPQVYGPAPPPGGGVYAAPDVVYGPDGRPVYVGGTSVLPVLTAPVHAPSTTVCPSEKPVELRTESERLACLEARQRWLLDEHE